MTTVTCNTTSLDGIQVCCAGLIVSALRQVMKVQEQVKQLAHQTAEAVKDLAGEHFPMHFQMHFPMHVQSQSPAKGLAGPPKSIFRCYEKTAFKVEEGFQRFDLRPLLDIVRASIVCTSLRALRQALRVLCQNKAIVLVRVKDRITQPTEAGWADILINFYFVEMKEENRSHWGTAADAFKNDDRAEVDGCSRGVRTFPLVSRDHRAAGRRQTGSPRECRTFQG